LNDKREILRKILSLIKSYEDNIEKDYYLKEVSNKLDIKLDIVYLEYNKTRINKTDSEISIYKTEKIITSEDLVA
jgi:hypothetical protein